MRPLLYYHDLKIKQKLADCGINKLLQEVTKRNVVDASTSSAIHGKLPLNN
jgi:hypothetical protein